VPITSASIVADSSTVPIAPNSSSKRKGTESTSPTTPSSSKRSKGAEPTSAATQSGATSGANKTPGKSEISRKPKSRINKGLDFSGGTDEIKLFTPLRSSNRSGTSIAYDDKAQKVFEIVYGSASKYKQEMVIEKVAVEPVPIQLNNDDYVKQQVESIVGTVPSIMGVNFKDQWVDARRMLHHRESTITKAVDCTVM
jgi:hypothetical protein